MTLAGAAVDQGKRWTDATEKIRQRTDLSAKALGGLGATVLTAAGLARFSDVFPLPDPPSGWQYLAVAGLLGGLVAMAVALAGVTYRLWGVSEPIFTSANPDRMGEDLRRKERERVEKIYRAMADLNEAPSLRAYEARGFRFERIAEKTAEEPRRAKLIEDALLIRSEVMATEARAATNLVRRRAAGAVRGPAALALYLLFGLGVLAFGLAADYLDSERSGRVASAKGCAEAVKAVKESSPATAGLLPRICGDNPAGSTPTAATAPSPDTEIAGALEDLSARYSSCVKAAETVPGSCGAIRTAMQQTLE